MPNRRLQRTKQAFKHNKEHRPGLLKLDPDVRVIIYKLVVGTQTIHVSHHGGNFRARVCQVPHADAHNASLTRIASDKVEIVDYNTRHHDCDHRGHDPTKTSAWNADSKTLLLICKKIADEAGELPSALNTFVFSCYSDFSFFKNRLKPYQLNALTSVVLHATNLSLGGHRVWPSGRAKPFEGLKHLTIFFRAREQGELEPTDAYIGGVRGKLTKIVDEFAGKKLKDVQVCVTSGWNNYNQFADPEMFGGLCRDLEAMALEKTK